MNTSCITNSSYLQDSAVVITSDHHLYFNEVIYYNRRNVSDWGPRRDPLLVVVPITLIYTLIFFSGLIGNIGTCIVIANNKSMHTATNYYLFSLAISDLLLLVSGLPQEVYSIWSKYPYVFGESFCLLQGFAAETSANATVLTITAFTVERYVAICHPFLSQTLSNLSRAIKFIILIWIVAICLAVPQALAFGIIMYDEEHRFCVMTRVILPHAFEISTFVFFVTPMSIITILYVLIGLQLRKSTKIIEKSRSFRMKRNACRTRVSYKRKKNQAIVCVDGRENNNTKFPEKRENNCIHSAQATKHVVKMLVAVVVAFFICWAPFHAQRLLAIYGEPNSANMVTTFTVLTYVSGVFYYLSTSINPLLYHILSHKFRIAFKKTFANFLQRSKVTRRSYSALSGKLSLVNSHVSSDSSRPPYSNSETAHIQQAFATQDTCGLNGREYAAKTSPHSHCNNSILSDSIGNLNEVLRKEYVDRLGGLYADPGAVNDEDTRNSRELALLYENDQKLKEIEIFQSQQLKIKRIEGKIQININFVTIPKSVTLPQLTNFRGETPFASNLELDGLNAAENCKLKSESCFQIPESPANFIILNQQVL